MRAVATGNFDGLHCGHQKIMEALRRGAEKHHGEPLMISYHPHTRHFLTGTPDPLLLTTAEEKKQCLSEWGLQHETVQFDQALANLEGCDFVEKVILKRFEASLWIFGRNHRFGARGQGNLQEVRQRFPQLEIQVVESLLDEGEVVSSSLIREYVGQGNISRANQLLGRPYVVTGTVIAGDGRGRQLGFPTANLKISPLKLKPALGVYAGTVQALDDPFLFQKPQLALMNVGNRPTFPGAGPSVEVHLPDWNGDLYGKNLQMKLNLCLRGEMRFSQVSDLRLQIAQDVEQAKASVLNSEA